VRASAVVRIAPVYALILLQTLVWIAIIPLAPTFADEFGLTGLETGMILSAASLAVLVVAFPLALLVDRLGARRVTITSACVFTFATLGQGLANEFWTLLVSRAGFGVAFGALWAGATAWLSDTVPEHRRARALAATATVTGVGFTTGPVLAGVLSDRYSPGTLFLVVTIAAAVVTAALVTVPAAAHTRSDGFRIREAFRLVGRDELVVAAVALIALIGLVGGGINLLVPLQLKHNGVSAGEIGLLFTLASAVYTVMSGVVARRGDRWATLRVGGLAALGTGATVFLVFGSTATVAAFAFVLLRAPFWSTMDTIIYPLAAAGAHRQRLGRGFVMGLVMLAWGVASTLGPLLAGGLADRWDPRIAYAGMIVCCALFGAALLRTDRRTARLDAPTPLS
jgi:MFS family permease